ncbi:MAG TPA: hypothetical protein VIK01_06785 [Polyangiaceae bacterium]
MSCPNAGVKALLKLQAQALRVQADALEASADSLPDGGAAGDELLGTEQTLARFSLGHEAVRAAAARGELVVSRGARGKLLVLESDVRRFIAARRYQPAPRRALPSANLDEWDIEADRSLRVVAGAKK